MSLCLHSFFFWIVNIWLYDIYSWALSSAQTCMILDSYDLPDLLISFVVYTPSCLETIRWMWITQSDTQTPHTNKSRANIVHSCVYGGYGEIVGFVFYKTTWTQPGWFVIVRNAILMICTRKSPNDARAVLSSAGSVLQSYIDYIYIFHTLQHHSLKRAFADRRTRTYTRQQCRYMYAGFV